MGYFCVRAFCAIYTCSLTFRRYAELFSGNNGYSCESPVTLIRSCSLAIYYHRRAPAVLFNVSILFLRLFQLTGFLQQPVPYSSMSEVRKYVVARWDPAYKNCLSIVLPDGSLLLQASNAYTRDQWYHSILWKVRRAKSSSSWAVILRLLAIS